MKALALAGLLIACSPAFGYKVYVYSEFTRIDPWGKVVPQDRGQAEPRHILSPAIPRNATSSLRIVIEMDKPGKFQLDIAQNPANAVRPNLYREVYQKQGDTWVPDKLVPVPVPYDGKEEDFAIPGQTHVSFWLDMAVKKDAEVDRIKVEPQVYIFALDDWFSYPMEVRVAQAVIPAVDVRPAALPDVSARSDMAALAPIRARVCGVAPKNGPQELTARAMIHRNAAILMSLAGDSAKPALAKVARAPSLEAICAEKLTGGDGPEWFLRFRDSIVRQKSEVVP